MSRAVSPASASKTTNLGQCTFNSPVSGSESEDTESVRFCCLFGLFGCWGIEVSIIVCEKFIVPAPHPPWSPTRGCPFPECHVGGGGNTRDTGTIYSETVNQKFVKNKANYTIPDWSISHRSRAVVTSRLIEPDPFDPPSRRIARQSDVLLPQSPGMGSPPSRVATHGQQVAPLVASYDMPGGCSGIIF